MTIRSEASRMVISMPSGTGRRTQLLAPPKWSLSWSESVRLLLEALLASRDCHPGPLITASDVWKTQIILKHHFKRKQNDKMKSRQVPLQLHPATATSSRWNGFLQPQRHSYRGQCLTSAVQWHYTCIIGVKMLEKKSRTLLFFCCLFINFWNCILISFSFLPPNSLSYSPHTPSTFMASFFINYYHIKICIYIYVPKYNLSGPYNDTGRRNLTAKFLILRLFQSFCSIFHNVPWDLAGT